jgi:hypothetical protein
MRKDIGMTLFACFRSVSIRATGASTAIAVAFLGAPTTAEMLSHRPGDDAAATAPQQAPRLAALDPGMVVEHRDHAPDLAAVAHALKAAGTAGYSAGPARPVFGESILVQPEFATSAAIVKPSGVAHLTRVVRAQAGR